MHRHARECPVCTYVFVKEDVCDKLEHQGLLHKIESKHVLLCKYCLDKKILRRSRFGYISDFCVPYFCTNCKKPTLLPTQKIKAATHSQRSYEYYKLKNFAKLKRYQLIWADYRYKDIFGLWPSKDGLSPQP